MSISLAYIVSEFLFISQLDNVGISKKRKFTYLYDVHALAS